MQQIFILSHHSFARAHGAKVINRWGGKQKQSAKQHRGGPFDFILCVVFIFGRLVCRWHGFPGKKTTTTGQVSFSLSLSVFVCVCLCVVYGFKNEDVASSHETRMCRFPTLRRTLNRFWYTVVVVVVCCFVERPNSTSLNGVD